MVDSNSTKVFIVSERDATVKRPHQRFCHLKDQPFVPINCRYFSSLIGVIVAEVHFCEILLAYCYSPLVGTGSPRHIDLDLSPWIFLRQFLKWTSKSFGWNSLHLWRKVDTIIFSPRKNTSTQILYFIQWYITNLLFGLCYNSYVAGQSQTVSFPTYLKLQAPCSLNTDEWPEPWCL